MPRALLNLQQRRLTVESDLRTIDLDVDGAGHLRRAVALDSVHYERASSDKSAGQFKGHAAVFDSRTWIGSKRYGFWEEIAPGAFNKSIRESDVRFLDQHDPARLLARNTNGTLSLSEDKVGLAVDADMAPTSVGRDVAILLDRGDLTQMSFAFDMIDYTWRTLDDGSEVLRHNEVQLWDVSTVTYPAYDDTDASLRSDFLACARAAGFDSMHVERLAQRLADPDDDLLAALRAIAADETHGPAESTRGTDTIELARAGGTGEIVLDNSGPAETTRTVISPLVARTNARRMADLAKTL